MSRKRTPQEQVHGKVSAGVMDAAARLSEDAEPDNDRYGLGVEPGGAFFHVSEGCANPVGNYARAMRSIAEFMEASGIKVRPYPRVVVNSEPQNGLFIRTGYYQPDSRTVVVFVRDRHPKDVLRSFAHEMVHHMQNLRGDNMSYTDADSVADNASLEELESEAYLKGNVLFRKWTESVQGPKPLNESANMDEMAPDEVDLSSFTPHRTLNHRFWKKGRLDSRIRLRLLEIADDFIDFLDVGWVRPDDIILTGSLSNFNWNRRYSDIDLHVVIDFSKVDERTDFVREYFQSKKKIWNSTHTIEVMGFPVEVYVQDTNEFHNSSGVYSLERDEWIEKPSRHNVSIGHVDTDEVRIMVSRIVNSIDALEKRVKDNADDRKSMEDCLRDAVSLFDSIKKVRSDGMASENGEVSEGNLVFKCLRRLKYIDKVSNLITILYDKLKSLP